MICPNCAAAVPPAVWKLVGAFVAAPLAVAATVVWIVLRALARPTEKRSLDE